jgi:hypothetical protein
LLYKLNFLTDRAGKGKKFLSQLRIRSLCPASILSFAAKNILQTRMGTQAEQGNFSLSPPDPEHLLLCRYWPYAAGVVD